MFDKKIIHTTGRNNCGGRCIIHAHVRDGEILRLTTDTPEAAGNTPPLVACALGRNYHKTFLSPDRLKTPLLRVGDRDVRTWPVYVKGRDAWCKLTRADAAALIDGYDDESNDAYLHITLR